jgi:hypothetical protein
MYAHPTSHIKIKRIIGKEARAPAIIQPLLFLKERTYHMWIVIRITHNRTRAMGSAIILQALIKKGPFP